MAYTTAVLKKKALKAIEEHNLYFIEDIVAYLPCSKKTFYNHKLPDLPDIKEALETNKVTEKVKMRKKWADSDNATLQIAHYKLISGNDERRKISLNYNEHVGKDGEKLFGNVSDEKAKELAKKIKGSSTD